jgi:hypothetical protein
MQSTVNELDHYDEEGPGRWPDCPPTVDLIRLAMGLLSPAEAMKVQAHVDICPDRCGPWYQGYGGNHPRGMSFRILLLVHDHRDPIRVSQELSEHIAKCEQCRRSLARSGKRFEFAPLPSPLDED